MPRRLGSRLLLEAFVIAAVAVVLGVLDHVGTVDLSSLQKILAIFGTWALVVLADWAMTRDQPEAFTPAALPPAPAEPLETVAAAVPAPVAVVPEPAPEPEPEPESEPQPEPIAAIGVDDSPRPCLDPTPDEEWAFLRMYLRDFANPDGALSVDFDARVRESFGDLIASARR